MQDASVPRFALLRALAVVGSLVFYVVGLAALHDEWQVGVGCFRLLPLLIISAFWGLRGALSFALLLHPLNLLLFALCGHAVPGAAFDRYKLIGWLFVVLMGAILGHLRDVSLRLQRTNAKLEHTLAQVHTLRVLSICAHYAPTAKIPATTRVAGRRWSSICTPTRAPSSPTASAPTACAR